MFSFKKQDYETELLISPPCVNIYIVCGLYDRVNTNTMCIQLNVLVHMLMHNLNICMMTFRNISIQNHSQMVTPAQLQLTVQAVQKQLDEHWQPVWHTHAQLHVWDKDQPVPADYWQVHVWDTSDMAQALGYHGETALSVPYGKVFVQDAQDSGMAWSITLSHEILEIMSNPWVNLSVLHDSPELGPLLYAYESCDAVQSDTHAYEIDQIKVSNFVYPAWFDSSYVPGTKFDHRSLCTRPFQILMGGYMPVLPVYVKSGWQSLYYGLTGAQSQLYVRNRLTRHDGICSIKDESIDSN